MRSPTPSPLLVASPPKQYIAPVGGGLYFTSVPAPVTVEQLDRLGTPLSLPMATAHSDTGDAIVTSSAPAIFPVGTTTVGFYAYDGHGASAVAYTSVTVRDTTPPTFVTVPAPIVVTQADAAGTPVTVPMATVVDNCECAAVSSDAAVLFPVGKTTVTFTAVDAAGNRATATTTVTVQAKACVIDFAEKFNSYDPHSDPAGWIDYQVKGESFHPKAGFRTARHDGTIVFESTADDRASEYRTPASRSWHSYEWSGRVRLPTSKSDASLLFYADVPGGHFYQLRIRNKGEKIELLKGFDDTLSGHRHASFSPHADRWYRFRIRVSEDQGGNRLRARVWSQNKDEPSAWALDATDKKHPLSSGGIAVLAADDDTWFDDFKVKSRGTTEACK